jgi:predicted DNA-binding transcriptional regulator AlpA
MSTDPTESTNTSSRGYADEAAAAAYIGYSRDQFRELIKRGLFPRGRPLTPDGKLLWRISDLDAAVQRAWRSRKARRSQRGIVRQRLEAKRRREGADV